MKKRLKRLVSAGMAAVLTISLLPYGATASETYGEEEKQFLQGEQELEGKERVQGKLAQELLQERQELQEMPSGAEIVQRESKDGLWSELQREDLSENRSLKGEAVLEGTGDTEDIEEAVKKVVDSLEELPQYENEENSEQPRGTAENPFVILELVPYEDFAEFGYLIGGCEPIKVEELYGTDVLATVRSMNTADVEMKLCFLFEDEKGIVDGMYPGVDGAEAGGIWQNFYGYYEVVEEGTGNFVYQGGTAGSIQAEAVQSENLEENAAQERQKLADREEISGENPGDGSAQESQGDDSSQETPGDGSEQENQEDNSSQETSGDSSAQESQGDGSQAVSLKQTENQKMAGSQMIETRSEGQQPEKEKKVTADLQTGETVSGTIQPEGEGQYLQAELQQEAERTEAAKQAEENFSYEVQPEIEDAIKAAGGYLGSFVKAEGGNLIWHTVQEFDPEYGNSQLWQNSVPEMALQEVGDRFYTTRFSDGDNKGYYVNHYVYKNREVFLTDTLGLDEEAAEQYSVVVKTITPEELNETPEWVDYSDLIYIASNEPKAGKEVFPQMWRDYNRLGHTSIIPENWTSGSGNYYNKENDLSWETALKIYEKVTAKTDFAALIMTDDIYNTLGGYQKKNVTVNVLDWNLRETGLTYQTDGYKENIYKLAVMLLCMNGSLFRSLYLEGENPVVQDGKHTLQPGNAADYWNTPTFLLVPPEGERSPEVAELLNGWQLYGYWNGSYGQPTDIWKLYQMTIGISQNEYKNWVQGHVYTYPNNTSIAQMYLSGQVGTNLDYFTDFGDYLEGIDESNPNPSDAVRYILDLEEDKEPEEKKTLRVLDIEPCVGLAKKEENGKIFSEPEWVLTENYLRMAIPSFNGEIEIVHQTTAEFNGKTEDLNSEYDLIYLGLDTGAYSLSRQNVTIEGKNIQMNVPDWNDNSMDGLIYFHTGDGMVNANNVRSGRNISVRFLWDSETGSTVESDALRFPGNDITSIKREALESFADAGHPIVASRYLYNLESAVVDTGSHMYHFVEDYREGKGVYGMSQPEQIAAAVSRMAENVTFTILPQLYNGSTENETSAYIPSPSYLPENALDFGFHVEAENVSDYAYSIYVDQNRDGKFAEDEKIIEDGVTAADTRRSYPLASSFVGLIQWKIVVYNSSNPNIRYTETGCSALRNASGAKKEVRVLQIMPKDGNYDGKLNLSENQLFKKYYSDLADYQISIDTITWGTFDGYFRGTGFRFDASKDVDGENPVNEDAIPAYANLSGYQMIIVGFGDTYGQTDLNNDNGAVEYLQYFAAQGKSILFVHDVTSMYNMQQGNGSAPQVFGSTANKMLRDLMGMNRYAAVSNQLTEEARESLMRYQAQHPNYDFISGKERHGFTYYALKRMGWTQEGQNANYGNKVPYRYMITNTEGNAVCANNDFSRTSGFNNNNDLTTTASKLNEGQITAYPYKIGDVLPIAETHGQWYQLNMEDPEVTVWYCLSDDHYCAGWNDTANNGRGTALTYGVSPNDAANNYYIYSKGNIFYSGVGHSTVNGDMEAKLFVNTMIAAYRASYEPPVIEVTNDEAVLNGTQNYSIELLREYDNGVTANTGENVQNGEVFTDADTLEITFRPIDYNPASTNLSCWIYLEGKDGSKIYVDEIVSLSDNTVLTADSEHKIQGIANGRQYKLIYKKSVLDTHPVVKFEVKNNKAPAKNTTILTLTVQPLFELD